MNINSIRIWAKTVSAGILILFSGAAFAQETINGQTQRADSVRPFSSGFIHGVSIETRPGYIFPTSSFLKGENPEGKYIDKSFSAHLRYSFRFRPNTLVDRIYHKPYQGIGVAYFSLGERKHLGDPVAVYLFQGARIAKFTPSLSLNYEWNFGISFGWKPYDPSDNPYNVIIGSEANAYLNAGLYLNWMLSRNIELTSGFTLSHFSNGNTGFPNAGLNTVDFKVGLAYNFNYNSNSPVNPAAYLHTVPEFRRHISYDVVLFGSWRRKGMITEYDQFILPDKYTVLGFNFTPMYNFGYRFRAGLSLDGVYDESANLYAGDDSSGSDPDLRKPPLINQMALGVSGRAEYVMPYFSIGFGMGVNVMRSGKDFGTIYQILALKMEITKSSFLHIGYSLSDFHDPNYLMLGLGFRFNNKGFAFHR